MSSANVVYTRAAILQWANTLLGATHASFADIQASDLSLLLYGILHDEQEIGHGSNSHGNTNNTGTDRSCSIHRAEDLLSLQEIQFTSQPTPTVRQRNTQHVLAMIRRLSTADPSVLVRTSDTRQGQKEGSGEEEEEGTAKPQPVKALPFSQNVLSESLTATDWLDGKAFVEELKVWRWLRSVAVARECTTESVRRNIESYLRGGGSAARGASSAPATTNNAAARALRDTAETEKEAAELPSEQQTAPSHHPRVSTTNKRQRADDVHDDEGVEHQRVIPNSTPAALSVSVSPILAAPLCTDSLLDRSADLTSTLHKAVEEVKRTGVCQQNNNSDGDNHGQLASCSSCPPVFEMALQGNISLLASMEEIRQLAINACIKKDMTELVKALSRVA